MRRKLCAAAVRELRGLNPPESCETPVTRGEQTLMAEPTGTHPFAPFEWMLSLRYLRARRKEGFISVIAGFSFLGIMLGVATLIIVMAVMNGFRQELLERSSASTATSDPAAGAAADRLGGGRRARRQGRRRAHLAAPIVEGQALASSPFNASGVLVRGIRARGPRQAHRRSPRTSSRARSKGSTTARASPSAAGSPSSSRSTPATISRSSRRAAR